MKNRSSSFVYSTKIWLTSVVFSPILYMAINWALDLESSVKVGIEIFGAIVLFILYGILFSLPNWLLLILGTKIIFKQVEVRNKKRFWTQGLVVVLATILFIFLFWNAEADSMSALLKLPASYVITLTIGVWVYDPNSNSFLRDNRR